MHDTSRFVRAHTPADQLDQTNTHIHSHTHLVSELNPWSGDAPDVLAIHEHVHAVPRFLCQPENMLPSLLHLHAGAVCTIWQRVCKQRKVSSEIQAHIWYTRSLASCARRRICSPPSFTCVRGLLSKAIARVQAANSKRYKQRRVSVCNGIRGPSVFWASRRTCSPPCLTCTRVL